MTEHDLTGRYDPPLVPRLVPAEVFRDGDVEWPQPRKAPRLEGAEHWAFLEDYLGRDDNDS